MKKIMLLMLITSLVMVMSVSCEGDIFQSISSFMGHTSENVLISSGVITPSTENVEAVKTTLAGVDDETDVADVADELRDSIEEILASEGETGSAGEMLDDPVDEEDIPTDVSDRMDALGTDLGVDIVIEDEGDLAVAILLTDLMDKAEAAGDTPTDEEKEELARDTQLLLDFIKKTSSIGNLDVTGAVGDLLEEMLEERVRAAVTREPSPEEEGYDLADILDIAGPVFEMYFLATDTDGNGEISEEEFDAVKSDYAKLRATSENGAASIVGSTYQMRLSDILYYISSMLVTENDNLLPVDPDTGDAVVYPSMRDLFNLVHLYLESGSDEAPTGSEWDFLTDEYIEDMMNLLYEAVLEPAPGESVTAFEETLINISMAIPDNDFITEAIQDAIDYLHEQAL